MKALVKITAAMAALTMAAAVIPAGITASAASETKSVSYLRLINGSFTTEEICGALKTASTHSTNGIM